MENKFKHYLLGILALAFSSGIQAQVNYCNAQATNTADDEIFNVSISTMSNTSNCTTTGGPGSILSMYSNFVGVVTAPQLIVGQTYSLGVTVGQCSGFQYSGTIYVWIDYNNNGSFTDPGELVYTTGSPLVPFAVLGTTYSTNISIPTTAGYFGLTRMRVLAVEGTVTGPCQNFTWGEVEDYNVNIIPNTPCAGAPASNSVLPLSYTSCPSYTNPNFTFANTYSVGGISYQWQTSTVSPVGPFTNVPGGTLFSLPVSSVQVTTWYQAIITCSTTGQNITVSGGSVFIPGTTTNSAPYFEGFEGIPFNFYLPNCSWSVSNFSNCLTYTAANTGNRVARTGSKFATFNALPAGTKYYYSNGIFLSPGITYSASTWYQTDLTGATNWSNLSILYGTSQSTTGLTNIASSNGPAVSSIYKSLGNTFTVATAGLYYIAIAATSAAGNAQFLSWDDLSITIPCSAAGNSPVLNIATSAATVCEGASISLTANGANSYTWSTGATTNSITNSPAFTTIYSVIGSNSITGCTNQSSLQVNVNPSPNVFAFAFPAVACAGSKVLLNANGASNYNWNNGNNSALISVNPTVTTSYTVIGVNSFNCTKSAVVTVSVNPLPSVNAAVSNANVCLDEDIYLLGNGAQSYNWTTNKSSQLWQGNPVLIKANALGQMSITVVGTNANNCENSSNLLVNVSACTGLESNEIKNGLLKIYPNPNTGTFEIENQFEGNVVYQIIDLKGQILVSKESAAKVERFDINELPNGVYFIKMKSDKAIVTNKLLKY
jgi:hypothetical protein